MATENGSYVTFENLTTADGEAFTLQIGSAALQRNAQAIVDQLRALGWAS